MWSWTSKFTVVWFYLSSRIVISLSSHYWNLVLRIGQSFPAIIASICYTNTCVPTIKFSKTLQTPHALFWLGSCCIDVSPAFLLDWNLSCSWLLLQGWGGGGSMMFAVRLQWQIEHRHLPWKPKIVVVYYCIIDTALVLFHSKDLFFTPLSFIF